MSNLFWLDRQQYSHNKPKKKVWNHLKAQKDPECLYVLQCFVVLQIFQNTFKYLNGFRMFFRGVIKKKWSNFGLCPNRGGVRM